MSKAIPSVFPARDLWLAALPLLPLVVLSLAVSRLFDPGEHLAFLAYGEAEYIARPGRAYVHFGDMLTYHALAAVHVCVCLVVIGWFLTMIRGLPAGQRARSYGVLRTILALLLLLIVFFAIFAEDSAIVQLGYKATCMALETAALPTGLTGAGCFVPGAVSKLTLLAWIPTFSGMGAVALAAAFAVGNASDLPSPAGPGWEAALDQRIAALEKSVYVLSAVLVSSTITITLFARLPVGLLKEDSGLAAPMSSYVIGLSTFWGALFTLTLVATFAGPALRMLRQTRGDAAAEAESPDLRAWVEEHIFVSAKRQLVNIVSLLAPLLVGPLSSLLSSLAGG